MRNDQDCEMNGPAPRRHDLEDVTADELWIRKGWEKTPLFMNELPSEVKDEGPIEALQSLIYDTESIEESIESLKERANELYKMKDYRQALGFYQQAIEVIESSKKSNDSNDFQDHQSGLELKLKTLFSNRAACHLALGNFRSCITDCELVTQGSLPTPIPSIIRKAFFRTAKAKIGLKQYEDALVSVQRVIELDKVNGEVEDPEFKKLVKEIQRCIEEREQVSRERLEEAHQKVLEEKRLRSALQARGIIISHKIQFPPSPSSLPQGLQPAHFAASNESNSSIVYPVYVFRPKDSPPSRDLILNWNEEDVFEEHLMELTEGLKEKEYRFYLISLKGKILRCGNGLSLKKVIELSSSKTNEDGIGLGTHGHLELYLLPKGTKEEEDWICETKAQFVS
ncbi:hypothetical protein DFH28DRAFT_310642 [Melampsora americana]|nr:hypothetical protein DFH28DRAFT_310642 [Melampsora americana]